VLHETYTADFALFLPQKWAGGKGGENYGIHQYQSVTKDIRQVRWSHLFLSWLFLCTFKVCCY